MYHVPGKDTQPSNIKSTKEFFTTKVTKYSCFNENYHFESLLLTRQFCLHYTSKQAILTIKSIVEFAETEGRSSVPEITNSIYEVLKVANNSDNEDSKNLEQAQVQAISKLLN